MRLYTYDSGRLENMMDMNIVIVMHLFVGIRELMPISCKNARGFCLVGRFVASRERTSSCGMSSVSITNFHVNSDRLDLPCSDIRSDSHWFRAWLSFLGGFSLV